MAWEWCHDDAKTSAFNVNIRLFIIIIIITIIIIIIIIIIIVIIIIVIVIVPVTIINCLIQDQSGSYIWIYLESIII